MFMFFSFDTKNARLGYMGHLTYISDEVCKLVEKCATDLEPELSGTPKHLLSNIFSLFF